MISDEELERLIKEEDKWLCKAALKELVRVRAKWRTKNGSKVNEESDENYFISPFDSMLTKDSKAGNTTKKG